jgi:hypothetical protein
MDRPSLEVLLLSRFPEAHEELLRALELRGIPVAVVRDPTRDLRDLRRHPGVVLIDLVYGAGLDRSSVERLNRERGRSLVVGLHHGALDDALGELADLSVDGYCRAENWQPIAGLAGRASSYLSGFAH